MEKGPRLRSAGTWFGSWSATPGSAAHDEEEALMPPQKVADGLVQELWQTLRASLEAQARCRTVALVLTATAARGQAKVFHAPIPTPTL